MQELAERYRFLHWELEFADIFADRGGFDLVLGNPPWIKVEWNEGGVMGDAEPLFVLRNFSASTLARLRAETLEKYGLRAGYLAAFEEIKDLLEGTVEQTVTDDTLPGGPRERTIVYHAPFDRCDRERDYETVWVAFERRFGAAIEASAGQAWRLIYGVAIYFGLD